MIALSSPIRKQSQTAVLMILSMSAGLLCIIGNMKILITPLIRRPKSDAAYYITKNIADLLTARGHACAVSAGKINGFRNAALYSCAQLKKPLFTMSGSLSYEEWMHTGGASSKEYLEEDTRLLISAIDEFRPDAVITIDRTAAVIAAKRCSVPCIAVVHSAMYRNISFASKTLHGLNLVLSEYDMEQVFRIHSVYDSCAARIVFGPIALQPFPPETTVFRIGSAGLLPVTENTQERVYVSLAGTKIKSNTVKKVIRETFEGAPYQVYAWTSSQQAEKYRNIHILNAPRTDLLYGASVCIHDGNDYITNQCAAAGTMQLVISDHEYMRSSNANALRRSGSSLVISEDELSVAELYEMFRCLRSDSRFRQQADLLKNACDEDGDLEKLYTFLTSRAYKNFGV